MRLLNVRTLTLQDLTGRRVLPYSISSHRWGQDEGSYKEFHKGRQTDGAGYRKIVNFCAKVKGQHSV